MLLATVYRYSAIRALEINMRGRLLARLLSKRLPAFGQPDRSVIWMWTVGMLSHECGTLPNLGDRRIGVGVEKVVGFQNGLPGRILCMLHTSGTAGLRDLCLRKA